jgi:TetR/AcrR family transcriptional regulator, regulator of cefoperazone and chloramphenicol sensitivity
VVQQRLLDIAVEAFGQHGIDGASTREIARAAGTAMSSITYHYGGKEGLYLATADYVAQQMGDLASQEALDTAIASNDPPIARQTIHVLVRRFIDRLQDERSTGWALFIMREQMNPTDAFERIYAGPMGHNARALVELICIATGVGDRQAARFAAISVFGQVLVLKAARATCRKLLEIETLSPQELAAYTDRVSSNVDAILDRMITERP